MSDKTTCLDEITARLEAEPDGPDLCPVSECEVCTQVRDARAMLAVVREVAKVAVPVGVTPSDDPWWKGYEEAMRRVRVQLAPLTETTEGGEGA